MFAQAPLGTQLLLELSFAELQFGIALQGGGLYASGVGTAVVVRRSGFYSNRAVRGGAVLVGVGAKLTAIESYFLFNSATSDSGGAVAVDGGMLELSGKFTDDVRWLNNRYNTPFSSMTQNVAAVDGGAIVVAFDGTLDMRYESTNLHCL